VPLVLPHPSTACQVLVIVFAQAVPPVTSPPTCCTVAPLHASDAVGGVKLGVAVHSTVAFASVPITCGGLSIIEIGGETVPLVLPHPSTACQVLVIVFAQAVPPVTSPPTCCTVSTLHASHAARGVQ